MPIIVTAGEPTALFVEGAIAHGANSVLAHPYSPNTLRQRIHGVFTQGHKICLKDGMFVLVELLDALKRRLVPTTRTEAERIAAGRGAAMLDAAMLDIEGVGAPRPC